MVASLALSLAPPGARALDLGCGYAFLIRHPGGLILFETGIGQGNDVLDRAYRRSTGRSTPSSNGSATAWAT
jgi:hypothetical protein